MKTQLKHLGYQILLVLFVTWIRIVGRTSKHLILNSSIPDKLHKAGKPHLISLWHNNIFTATYCFQDQNYTGLVSASKDGEHIKQIAEQFGFGFVRGSSSKGGKKALLSLVQEARGGKSLIITPDGPRGPKFELQSGVVLIAKLTGIPIVPWHYEAVHQKLLLKTWDQHKIPRPFTTIVQSFGDPIYVPSELSSNETEAFMKRVEDAMNNNMQRAIDVAEKMRSPLGNRQPF